MICNAGSEGVTCTKIASAIVCQTCYLLFCFHCFQNVEIIWQIIRLSAWFIINILYFTRLKQKCFNVIKSCHSLCQRSSCTLKYSSCRKESASVISHGRKMLLFSQNCYSLSSFISLPSLWNMVTVVSITIN